MQNQESIYQWIPKTVEKPVKEKLFHSHHNPNIAPTGSTLWYFFDFIYHNIAHTVLQDSQELL